MRPEARVSPSWPGGDPSRPDTLKQTDQTLISANLLQTGRAIRFFERFDDPLVLSRMTGPGAHVGEAEFLEELSDIARMKVDAEPLGDDPLEIDPSLAHDAVLFTIRPGLDDLRKLRLLLRRQARLGTRRPILDEALGPAALKRCTRSRSVWRSMPPILVLLLGPSRPGPPPAKKPPALVDVLRPPGQRPKLLSRIILSQSDR